MKFWQNVAFSETEQLIDVAKIAEQAGFHGLTTADHIITPATIESTYPYAADGKAWWDPNTHFPDDWGMYCALAQHTTTGAELGISASRLPSSGSGMLTDPGAFPPANSCAERTSTSRAPFRLSSGNRATTCRALHHL